MPRIFIADQLSKDQEVFLPSQNYHYVVHTLRLKQGDHLYLVDTEGKEYLAGIKNIKEESVLCRVLSLERYQNERTCVKTGLIQAIPKTNKMDVVVREATELGINHIYPLISERTKFTLPRNAGFLEGRLSRYCFTLVSIMMITCPKSSLMT